LFLSHSSLVCGSGALGRSYNACTLYIIKYSPISSLDVNMPDLESNSSNSTVSGKLIEKPYLFDL
tara:strand:+ start:595 stop:789 length:195 start_codon:yes stop_codon:yes gene_type:complete